jgi:hypothetical protein
LSFLLQGHAFYEIVDSGIKGLGGVQIERFGVGLSNAGNGDKKREKG